MKRVIALSDSHEMTDRLREALALAFDRGPVDVLAFLGDGLAEWNMVSNEYLKRKPGLLAYGVKGNNDWSRDTPAEQCFLVNGVRFFLCHGQQYRVKYGLDMLRDAAREREAQVALFGHTHRTCMEWLDGRLFLNPGAICAYGPKAPCYADIRVEDDGRVQARLVSS